MAKFGLQQSSTGSPHFAKTLSLSAATLMAFSTSLSHASLSPSQSISQNRNFSCVDLQKATQRLTIHAENILNRDVTRTPEGGPFRRIDLKCFALYCEQIRRDDFRLVYAPKHVDANGSGYVRYPNINLQAESAALNTAAHEVQLLASQGACGAKVLSSSILDPGQEASSRPASISQNANRSRMPADSPSRAWTEKNPIPVSSLIKYKPNFSIQSDSFSFANDGQLTSWSRTLRDGTLKHYSIHQSLIQPQVLGTKPAGLNLSLDTKPNVADSDETSQGESATVTQ
jgi:flagellar basal body rod protein FlgC